MNGDAEDMYAFVCPECDESMEVNHAMKVALVENGCVICGASVASAAFTPTDSSKST